MTDDVQMMTYADAADALGVKVDSVKRRARNRRWRREKGNDGLVRIGVPTEILSRAVRDNPADDPSDNPADILRLEKKVSALETEVSMLREREMDLKAERDVWRSFSERSWWQRIIHR